MNDFELRLRDAMSAAGGEPPPPGLMEGIRRRHRHHLIRVGAGCVAVVAALALVAPPVTHALRSAASGNGPASHGRGTAQPCPSTRYSIGCAWHVGGGVASSPPLDCPQDCGPPASAVRAAAGTVLRNCQSWNGSSQDIPGYRAHGVRAGPVWFVGARGRGGGWPASQPLGNGQVQAVGELVAMQAGTTAVVRVAPGATSRFRFLTGFASGNKYTVRAGEPGVTLAACPAWYLGPLTVFWIGYLNDGLRCVPFEVSQPGHRPIRVTLSASGGTCAA